MLETHETAHFPATEFVAESGSCEAVRSARDSDTFVCEHSGLEAALRAFFARPQPQCVSASSTSCGSSSQLGSSCDSIAIDPEQLPQTFGRYRILRRLGGGGMGVVFLAFDTRLRREVALKIPRLHRREPAEVMGRFYREARTAAGLNHPLICPVYDMGEIDGTSFISMAYVPGQPLSALIHNGRILDQTAAAKVIQLLASALGEAHDHGVVHRDLKPSNILVNEHDQPVIVDFGLARRLDCGSVGESHVTQEGVLLGTPVYMSPEQVEGIEPVGPRSDIYSLGVVLFQLLTGCLPFQGSFAAILGKIAIQDPPRPSALHGDIHPALETICLKMMAKAPEDRYSSMWILEAALSRFLDEVGTATGPAAHTTARR